MNDLQRVKKGRAEELLKIVEELESLKAKLRYREPELREQFNHLITALQRRIIQLNVEARMQKAKKTKPRR